jgi:hypothetical protein
MACLAGGAQLHTRANLVALGGRIDTTSLAEDTFTTFQTQLNGRRVVFEPHATVWAEEPGSITGLWKQRLRWARGNVQVTRRYRRLWFRPNRGHRLGGVSFGVFWFCLFLQPIFMIVSSCSLIFLYLSHYPMAWTAFRILWLLNACTYVFTTGFALLIDPQTARHTWRQGFMFPGVVSLTIVLYTCVPRLFGDFTHEVLAASHISPARGVRAEPSCSSTLGPPRRWPWLTWPRWPSRAHAAGSSVRLSSTWRDTVRCYAPARSCPTSRSCGGRK